MRDLINIIEAAQTDLSYYMEEGCGAFAYAVWAAKGKPQDGDFYVISNVDGEPWYGDPESDEPTHDFEATHVYYSDRHGSVDVMGYRAPEDMMDDLHILGHANIEGAFSPEYFRQHWMGDDDSVPLYCTEEMVREALEVIMANPERYRIGQ